MAFLGNHVPRLCGLATFTRDLCEAVATRAPEAECFAGAINDKPEGYAYPSRVRFEIQEKELDSYRRAADFLNFSNVDVLCVQHEFGIYGGPAGAHLLALLSEVHMPVVTTLHTLLEQPDANQREVMREVIARSERLVVMAKKGAEILTGVYGVPSVKVDVIPHGIPDMPFKGSESFKEQFGVAGRDVLLTFGLLGPGKGIDHVIEALPSIVRDHPNVVYLVLGATHPHLVAREGERYRMSLQRLAEDRGVKDHVIFYNRFVSQEDLREFIGATDIYLTPYLNEAQITSGTLSTVFGAGKPVVSTPYWHARELLADDRGVLVPFHDPTAIAAAVSDLLSDPERRAKIGRQAHAVGRGTLWPVVARRYLDVFQQARADRSIAPRTAFAGWTVANRPLVLPPVRLDHVERMSDGTGILQHATYDVPNYHEGYCTDDNARAFLLGLAIDELGGHTGPENARRLATRYLAFLAAALNYQNGRFRNFMSYDRRWLETEGSEDSHGRALWALGSGSGRSRQDGHQRLCAALFQRALPVVVEFSSPRAWAFTLLGLHPYLRQYPEDKSAVELRGVLANRLITIHKTTASEQWPWFEDSVTYDNARLCQALLLAGWDEPGGTAVEVGLTSLRWLASIQISRDHFFRPIGSNGFYDRHGGRADFDQQPVEVLAMVSACHTAFRLTRDATWLREAKRAFEWFLGRNDLGTAVYDFASGGCGDGLHVDRVSENQGAESTLAFQLALAEMHLAAQPVAPPSSS